jgi:O-antigen ligase
MLVYLPLILFVAVGHILYDPVVLLASAVLSISLLVKISFIKFKFSDLNIAARISLGIFFMYAVSAIINKVPFIESLVGNYQRNFGLLYWASVVCIFIIFSSKDFRVDKFLFQALPIFAAVALFYGLLQRLDVDPLPWKNEFNSVQLTLGNPNFAGALLGMISVVFLDGMVRNEKIFLRISYFFMWCLNLFVAQGTNSLQSYVLIVVSSSVYISTLFQKSKNDRFRMLSKSLFFLIFITPIFVLFTIFSKIQFLANFKAKFYFEGNVEARLDYWNIGLHIFKDHFFIGVGPDQFQKYAALYRDANQILRDGTFVIPDKAHNTLIDQFANGGVFVGLLWCLLVILISFQAIKLSTVELEHNTRVRISILSSLWFSYIFQAFISPDQIQLSVLGFISASLIIRESIIKNLLYSVSRKRAEL